MNFVEWGLDFCWIQLNLSEFGWNGGWFGLIEVNWGWIWDEFRENWGELVWIGLNCFFLGWIGLNLIEFGWILLNWAEIGWIGLALVKLGWILLNWVEFGYLGLFGLNLVELVDLVDLLEVSELVLFVQLVQIVEMVELVEFVVLIIWLNNHQVFGGGNGNNWCNDGFISLNFRLGWGRYLWFLL